MKCVVTGGCGFIGSALVRHLLAEGHQIVVVDDLSRGSAENLGSAREHVTMVEQDITVGLRQNRRLMSPRGHLPSGRGALSTRTRRGPGTMHASQCRRH